MKIKILLLSLGLMAISGCAMPPNQTELAGLPVIQFGEDTPGDGEYILHFPAGQDIPTDVSITGDIFQKPDQHILTVQLNRDIYSYKDWISYDKQTWLAGQDVLGLKLDIKVPGYHYPKPGHIKIDLHEKKKQQK